MADNVPITAGSGTSIATDDIASVHYQRVKPQLGADGAATDMLGGAGAVAAGVQRTTLASDDPAVVALQIIDDWDESDRAKVNVIAGQAGIAGGTGTDGATVPRVTLATNVGLPAGEAHLGEIGGKSAVVAVTLSTDTSAYASGDLIADTQQIDAFFRKTDGTGVINSINIIDEDNQGVALYIIFMSTSTSLGSENSAPNISDANLTAGFQGIVSVATTDYVTISGAKVATIRNIGLPVKAVSGTDDIYIAVLNSTGTPTFTASGLEMRIGVLLD